MAYKVFWWQVELLIAGVAGMCLLPCLMLRQTALWHGGALLCGQCLCPLSARGHCWRASLWQHLDVFAVSPVLSQKVGVDAAMQAASAAVAMAWVLAACFLAVNKLAGMLTSGIPGMAGGQSIASLGRMVATGAAAGRHGWAAAAVGAGRHGGRRTGGVQAIGGAPQWQPDQSARKRRGPRMRACRPGAHGQNLGRLTTLMRGADPTSLMGADVPAHAGPADAGRRGSSTIKPTAARAITT